MAPTRLDEAQWRTRTGFESAWGQDLGEEVELLGGKPSLEELSSHPDSRTCVSRPCCFSTALMASMVVFSGSRSSMPISAPCSFTSMTSSAEMRRERVLFSLGSDRYR